jgi:integrase
MFRTEKENLRMPKRGVHDRDGVSLRKGSFYISFIDAQGRRKQRKLKGVHTLTQARELRSAELHKVEKARTLGYAPPSEKTFSEIIPRYFAHQKARLTAHSFQRTRSIVENNLKPMFGAMRLADIRRGDTQKYVTERVSEVSPASVIKELNTLKHIFNLAIEWELISLNPCAGIGKRQLPRIPAGRVRYLQPTELRAVLNACPLWLRPVVGLLALTGMRRSELLGLRWLNVDRENKRVLLSQTKNGDGRIVYLNSLACQIIDSIPRLGESQFLFPETIQLTPANVSVTFQRVCRRVGIQDFRLHDLRHTAASWLRMQGADIHTVAQLLGHRDLRMAARYQHLSPTYLQAAVEGLDRVFGPETIEEDTKIGGDGVTIEPPNQPKLALAGATTESSSSPLIEAV